MSCEEKTTGEKKRRNSNTIDVAKMGSKKKNKHTHKTKQNKENVTDALCHTKSSN